MKTIKLILATIVVISLVIILKWGLVTNDHKKPLNSNACVTEEGSSVTFIMGSDKPNTNDFYKNATYYYHMHPIDKTDFVILSCKSLEDVLDYLTLQSDHTYFETINIVCHGNPWQGPNGCFLVRQCNAEGVEPITPADSAGACLREMTIAGHRILLDYLDFIRI